MSWHFLHQEIMHDQAHANVQFNHALPQVNWWVRALPTITIPTPCCQDKQRNSILILVLILQPSTVPVVVPLGPQQQALWSSLPPGQNCHDWSVFLLCGQFLQRSTWKSSCLVGYMFKRQFLVPNFERVRICSNAVFPQTPNSNRNPNESMKRKRLKGLNCWVTHLERNTWTKLCQITHNLVLTRDGRLQRPLLLQRPSACMFSHQASPASSKTAEFPSAANRLSFI